MGDKDHGCDIISTLESWGGSNYFSRIGNDPEYAYFINDLGTIDLIHNSAFLSEEMKNFYFMFWHDYSIECHLKVGETINYGGQDYDVDIILFDANNRCIVYKLKSFGIGVEYITNKELTPTEECQTEEENNEYLCKNNMKRKLAIKGHPTRGKEVIEILEMSGGKHSDIYGSIDNKIYYIDDNGFCSWDFIGYEEIDKYEIFTLEEFLRKFPYKVGDKVYTKSNAEGTVIDMFWDGIEILYQLSSESVNALGYFHTNELKPDKETNMNENKFGTAKEPLKPKSNAVKLVDGKVVDDLEKMSVKNHKMGPKSKLPSKYYEDRLEEIQSNQDIDKTNNNLNGNEYPIMEGVECNEYIKYSFPDGYEFVDTDYTGVYLKPIKPKYPKTYKECCDVLGLNTDIIDSELRFHYPLNCGGYTTIRLPEMEMFEKFIQLYLCKNAYWKIAGEEMGLGKPWEPDWSDVKQSKFGIHTVENQIRCITLHVLKNLILVFPTVEMRDTFYENFKKEIEQCKELL